MIPHLKILLICVLLRILYRNEFESLNTKLLLSFHNFENLSNIFILMAIN